MEGWEADQKLKKSRTSFSLVLWPMFLTCIDVSCGSKGCISADVQAYMDDGGRHLG